MILCRLDQIDERIRTMTESVDQGFADVSADLDALSAADAKELAFLQNLENARGSGQLSVDQQATLDALRARVQAMTAADEAASVDPAAGASVPVDAGMDQSGAADPSADVAAQDPSDADVSLAPGPVPTMPAEAPVDEGTQPA